MGEINRFTAMDIAQYMAKSTLEQIREQCLDLVRINIFKEAAEPESRVSNGFEPSFGTMVRFHGEPEDGVRTFRFASMLLQHVASNLVLEVQRQQILRKMKTARRRSSYTQNLDHLQLPRGSVLSSPAVG